jgi:hypothetical protein
MFSALGMKRWRFDRDKLRRFLREEPVGDGRDDKRTREVMLEALAELDTWDLMQRVRGGSHD